ncbi:MAG: hypothetical protein A2W91_14465 [Bacteroidetes bacterium GWF2_38_335]|nr:MAG: hypothetical protein A2W91_14465 [Bacteroidetes bacterium GWF2_38_335]OFY79337.1 MAG: hypothetical protein A2281_16690 [Bacteroidetes bacterium RIFOXYA12_FULL_38_20]HBS85596.1 hypothetical protein [Bacteroidales bacterium]
MDNPELSIVICAYNSARFIENGLNSYLKQTAKPESFELLIVDNNSPDDTAAVCNKFISEHPEICIKYFFEKNQGLSFARNRGIKEAKGAFVSFVDDDAVVNPEYAEKLINAFHHYSEHGALGGIVHPVYPDGKEPDWFSPYLNGIVARVNLGNEYQDFSKKYPAGCNMAFRKSIFDVIGYFNTDLTYRGDEKFIFRKIHEKRIKVLYAPDVIVYHSIPEKRISREGVIKISRDIGISERISVKNKPAGFAVLLVILFLKWAFSLILFLKFWFNKQPVKGKFLVLVMYNRIKGFTKSIK